MKFKQFKAELRTCVNRALPRGIAVDAVRSEVLPGRELAFRISVTVGRFPQQLFYDLDIASEDIGPKRLREFCEQITDHAARVWGATG